MVHYQVGATKSAQSQKGDATIDDLTLFLKSYEANGDAAKVPRLPYLDKLLSNFLYVVDDIDLGCDDNRV